MAARSTLTVVSGNTITSSWGNSVRDHVVPFTTSNDVTSEGQLASNTTTNKVMVHNGTAAVDLVAWGAWETFTPGILQGAGEVLTASSIDAYYTMIGRTVIWSAEVVVGSVINMTAGDPIIVGLPVTARTGQSCRGCGFFYDASSGIYYSCTVMGPGSQTASHLVTTSTDGTAVSLGDAVFTAAVAAGDTFRIGGSYEAAG